MSEKRTPMKAGTRPSQADFRFFLRATAASEDDGRPTILVTASSSDIDLTQDRFAKSALRQMQQAFGGMTIFLNHRYGIPEDVFGMVRKATLTTREGHTDLDLVIAVEDTSPRAMQTHAMIKNGTRLGVSVGVLVVDADYTDEEVDGQKVMEITDVIPLEASIVGIPANRRSWVQNALKAAGLLADKSGMALHRARMGAAEEEDMYDIDPRFVLDLDDEDEEEDEEELETTGVDDDDDDEEDEEENLEDEGSLYAVTFEDGVVHVLSLWNKKTVVGSHRPPTNDRDQAWSGRSAIGRMRKWASSDGSGSKDKVSWGKYRRGFVWYDSENSENFGGYKAPHHDIIDGTFKTHFRGCVAAAVVISGGRGGLSIPEGDVAGVKRHIATHYHQYDEKAPWEREKGAAWLPIEAEVAKELGVALDDRVPSPEAESNPAKVRKAAAPVADEIEGVTHVGDLGVIIDEEKPKEKALVDDVAAENFTDVLYNIFRAFYYRMYDILASEESIGAKRSAGAENIKDFAGLVTEAFEEVLEDLEESSDEKVLLEALRQGHETVAAAFDAPAQLLELLAKTFILAEAHKKLQEEKDSLETEVGEAQALAQQCLKIVNEVMDLPLARKIAPEEIVADLTTRFPALAPQITAELARRRAASSKIG